MVSPDMPHLEHLFKLLTNWNLGLLIVGGIIALAIGLISVAIDRIGNQLLDAKDAQLASDLQGANKKIADTTQATKNLEHDNLGLRGQVATLETKAATQQERAATAEKKLLQLRESLKDRIISPDQEKILIASLTGAPSGAVEVWWTASDTDSFGLAKQMVEIFKKSGWPLATERFAAGGTGNGFFIAVHDHMNAPAPAVSIQNAFKLIGIDMNGFSKPEMPEGSVYIYIGHKIPPP